MRAYEKFFNRNAPMRRSTDRPASDSISPHTIPQQQ
jgi:hypothetical protein